MDAESNRPDKSHRCEGSRRPVKWGRLSFGYFSLAGREKSLAQLGETSKFPSGSKKLKGSDPLYNLHLNPAAFINQPFQPNTHPQPKHPNRYCRVGPEEKLIQFS